jgi:hypothetical protein
MQFDCIVMFKDYDFGSARYSFSLGCWVLRLLLIDPESPFDCSGDENEGYERIELEYNFNA